jgi:hypothetical protein
MRPSVFLPALSCALFLVVCSPHRDANSRKQTIVPKDTAIQTRTPLPQDSNAANRNAAAAASPVDTFGLRICKDTGIDLGRARGLLDSFAARWEGGDPQKADRAYADMYEEINGLCNCEIKEEAVALLNGGNPESTRKLENLKEAGFTLEINEGEIHVSPRMSFIRQKIDYLLTPPLQNYLQLTDEEVYSRAVQDIYVDISPTEMADRLALFEDTAFDNARFVYRDKVLEDRAFYRKILLCGWPEGNSTKVFIKNESGKVVLADQYKEGYDHFIETYPKSPTWKTVKDIYSRYTKADFDPETVLPLIEKKYSIDLSEYIRLSESRL